MADEDDDWMADLNVALSGLPDDDPPDAEEFDDRRPEDLLRSVLGTADQIEPLNERDRQCFYESAAACVRQLITAYGNSNEGPHRVVFLGDDHNWRAACDTAMSRVRQMVRQSCLNDGLEPPQLPSLYLRGFKRISGTYGSVEMTMTCAKPDTSRDLVEIFQRRGIVPDAQDRG